MMSLKQLVPLEVSVVAFGIVGALWMVTFLAAIFRWRVFDRIRVVYRFASEFERRVHRRFSDSQRQRTPFGSIFAKLADASTAALGDGDDRGNRSERRLAYRYRKNSGDEMLALLQRSLVGEAGGWSPSPETSSSQLPTIGHAVRFALNENPVLSRLGGLSLSLAHRVTDCAPWVLCFLACAASAALIGLALQLVGGPEVFQGPSIVGFAICLAPIVSAALATCFLYVFYRFFDPERLYDRTVQKLTGSLEVLWQDASQRGADVETRLPSAVNAPVSEEQVQELAEQGGVREEDVAFLTGDRPKAAVERVSVAAEVSDEPEEVTLLSEIPPADRWDPPPAPPVPMSVASAAAWEPASPAPTPSAAMPEIGQAPAPASTGMSLEDWSLSPPMTPTPPTVTAAGVGSDDEGPATMPEFSLPKEMADVPSPLWPAEPVRVVEQEPEAKASGTDWNIPLGSEPMPAPPVLSAPMPAPPVPATAVTAPPTPESPPDEPTLWNASLAAAPAAPPDETTLWNATPNALPQPTVTVRRAANTPATAPSGENTGEWSLSGSHDLRAMQPPKEEVTQEVPLRPVATAGTKPATIVRKAPATTAPAAPADASLWNPAPAESAPDEDRMAVLRHRLSMVEQYLQKATVDFSQGAISEAMWQEETERWSLEREKLVRELAQITAKKRGTDAA